MCISALMGGGKPKVPALPPTPAPTPRPTDPPVRAARRRTRQQAAAARGQTSNIRNQGGARGLQRTEDSNFGRTNLLGGTSRRT